MTEDITAAEKITAAVEQIIDEIKSKAPFIPNAGQTEAIERMTIWYQTSHKPYFVLGGYAGTGKTSTMRTYIRILGIEGNVALCAYTAKAAKVLSLKTNMEATTVHSLIYSYRTPKLLEAKQKALAELRGQTQTPDRDERIAALIIEIDALNEKHKGKTYIKKNVDELQQYSLIVCDECSMISEKMFNDLLSFGIKVLFIGDPGQLDPIKENRTEKTLHELAPVDFLLDKIERHDNAIPEMAQLARKGQYIPFMQPANGFGKIKKNSESKLLITADQVICFQNRTRRELNKLIRDAKGLASVYPVAGEKVVCRLNNHDLGIARGVTYTLTRNAKESGKYVELHLDGIEKPVKADRMLFHAYNSLVIAEDVDASRIHFRKEHPPFDFGYVITCHSAQGSEWEKVLIWDDFSRRIIAPADYAKWLYTAITRATKYAIVAA